MRTPLAALTLVASLAVLATAAAHVNITSTPPEGPFLPGESYEVTASAYLNCAVIGAEYLPDQELTFTIANKADYPWLNATETTVAVDPFACAPVADAPTPGIYQVFTETVTFSPSLLAPALLEPVSLQPGLTGEVNEGGAFDAIVAYNPAFNVSLGDSYSYNGTLLTIPVELTNFANAESTFHFEVLGELPEGVEAHIQETLSVLPPYIDGAISSLHTVEMHVSGSTMDHRNHDMMGMENHTMEDMSNSTMQTMWDTLDLELSVRLSNTADANQTSDVQTFPFRIQNDAPEPTDMDQDHDHDDHMHSEDEDKLLPNVGIVAVLGGLGALAIARRRAL